MLRTHHRRERRNQPTRFLKSLNMYVTSYAKFLKDLCTKKRNIHIQKKAFLIENVSFILQYNISCKIGNHTIENTLLDLGASVNLLSYSVFVKLRLGELHLTLVVLYLTDQSMKIPRGIVEDVFIQVNKFYFLLISL